MDLDRLIRYGSLAALPALAAAIWLLRSPAPAPHETATPASASVPVLGDGLPPLPAATGQRADLVDGPRRSAPPVERRAQAAADLPPARPGPAPAVTSAPHAKAKHHHDDSDSFTEGPCGNVRVRLITASKDPKWSFASIATGPDKTAHMRRVGDRVEGFRVAKIDWDRVWLERGGARCAVGMHAGARPTRADPVMAPVGGKNTLLPADDPAPVWQVPDVIASAITQDSPTAYRIAESALKPIFDAAADLLAGTRIEPLRRNEHVVGITLNGIPADSLLDRLGVQSGDVVLELNGSPCTTFDGALQALEAARQKRQLVALLERQGQRFDLTLGVGSAAPPDAPAMDSPGAAAAAVPGTEPRDEAPAVMQ
jgi:type II secretion system protein C